MYKTGTPVKDLRADFILAQSRHVDLSEVGYEWWDMAMCAECRQVFVTEGYESHCPECGQTVYDDGPMMNYLWPVDLRRVGGSPEDGAKALRGTAMVLVKCEDAWYLGLGGAGMDMTWDICMGYMRLGYLPPTDCADLPGFRFKNKSTMEWIIAGLRRAIRIQQTRLKGDLRDIRWTASHYLGS